MIVPVRELLAEGAALLPPALVSPAARARLAAAAVGLPAAASCAAVECRLGGSERVDLLVCLTAAEGGHRALVQRRAELDLLSTPAWARVVAFCAEWADPGSPLYRGVPLLWLELDLPDDGARGPSSVPAPYPFPCVEPAVPGGVAPARPGEVGRTGDGAALPEQAGVIRRALALLLGEPPPPAVDGALFRCIARLPPSGRAMHVAPLAVRERAAVRLVVAMAKADVPAYLARIDWPGSIADIEALLDSMVPFTSHVGFHLDVGAAVEPMLGLEISFPVVDLRWATALDRLVALGACLPDKRDAILAWPADARPWPGRAWPTRLRQGVMLKLVYRPDAPLEAKAYLGITPYVALFG
ncbi:MULTISPECIES: hypothetical protein [Sorangium]|uniref:Uncharacterized protein n=1 Tax=Sorangium cellulosum TaxID=56 RepID=A0A4P2QNB4_SORCE|nr:MULTISPECIES: hypothetical protein [Sorangium]AUX31321.1 uncharacterized protein SOCE836_034500 [Sorangium cellulosum]WCQ90704.1 hypothetical protein NQZ70_03415 [Sorangium sp. Soce836]